MPISNSVQNSIHAALAQLYPENNIPAELIITEKPPQPELGDIAVPLFPLIKILRENPHEIASKVSKICAQDKSFTKVEAASGFVNFWLQSDDLFAAIQKILQNPKQVGQTNLLADKKIMVEYSSPNTNKPLTVGHARNNFIGMSIANILVKNSAEVIRAQIFNNRGVHICKSMFAYQQWGADKTPESEQIKPDHLVGNYYVRFAQELEKNPEIADEPQKMLQRWEQNNPEVRALWGQMNSWVYTGLQETYDRIGSVFDKNYYESDLWNKGREVVQQALEKKICYKLEDGAAEIDLSDVNLDKKILLRRDGTTVYITQDLETTRLKFEEFDLDEAMWVVGDEQRYHFQVLFELCQRFEISPRKKCHHLAYAMVELPTGKMSSRSGIKVDLDDWLDEIEDLARKIIIEKHSDLDEKEITKRAQIISLGAAKFQLLRNSINKKVIFNPQEAISFEGATGPYLQYAHARICSILRNIDNKITTENINWSHLTNLTEKALGQKLSNYQKAIERAAHQKDPAVICNYLLDLAQSFSSFYTICPVLKAEIGVREARIALCTATKIILQDGLEVLGIEAPEKM